MDSLIAASCRNATIVLAVAEDDEVGRQTNVNLARFLQTRKNVRVVYTVINKGRNIHSYSDIQARARHRSEFTILGVIPFDMDVLEDFGSDQFWTIVTETLYFRAVLDAWNALSKFVDGVRELSVSKYRFPPRIFMQPSHGRYTFMERILRIYSIAFVITGAAAWFYGEFRQQSAVDLYQLIAVGSILVGVACLVLSTSGFQMFIRGQARDRERRDRER
jgi:hypothetical protein